jgi:hypothetical protein
MLVFSDLDLRCWFLAGFGLVGFFRTLDLALLVGFFSDRWISLVFQDLGLSRLLIQISTTVR